MNPLSGTELICVCPITYNYEIMAMPYRPGLFAILLAPKVAVGCRCDPYREYNFK